MNIDYDYVLDFATKKHAGQFRADGKTPYIVHPIKVAEIVRRVKQSADIDYIVAAALLHDTLEDTYTSYQELKDEFGEMVASMVMEVTTASYVPLLIGKSNYLKRKMEDMSSYALVVKLADRLANILDSASLPPERKDRLIVDTADIIEYLEDHRELTSTHRRLISEINEELNKIDLEKVYKKRNK